MMNRASGLSSVKSIGHSAAAGLTLYADIVPPEECHAGNCPRAKEGDSRTNREPGRVKRVPAPAVSYGEAHRLKTHIYFRLDLKLALPWQR